MNIEIQSSIVESSIVEWSLSEESPPSLGPIRGAGLPLRRPPPRPLNVSKVTRVRKRRTCHRVMERESYTKIPAELPDRRRRGTESNRQERVWQSRTLLPGLPGESVVPPSDSLALRGSERAEFP